MARLVFDHVTKHYPGAAEPVVKDLSLKVEDREFLVLVGPSGCGKSTALRMIAGLESITSGSLFIGDRRVNDVAPKDRDIAMVFQSYALYPHMTCFDNMGFSLRIRGVSRAEIERRVLEAARALQVESLLARRPRELSGGQRQRVAIGRAIVRSPKVLLMDEPLSNLDAKLRSSMRAEVKRIHRELGTTIVYVTHDQTEAMTLGDRVAVLHAGEIVQLDAPDRIYSEPANVFVATFIGSPEMNLIPAEVVVEKDRAIAVGPSFRFALPDGWPRAGSSVLIGIRPEHLSPSANAARNGAREEDVPTFSGRIELVESTGTEAFVHLATPAGRLICKTNGADHPSIGSTLTVFADPLRLHIFDSVTEGRIK
ncbi:MAG TPA: sn-glycerol-3-phosphate ABC transporter ATP-binding protein UgpC [Labilithrix sp.]|nr:sn-glycerol-3-phosphate ABC transporter ATP-binding protein UgpC [Labilithrix sp.]